MKVLRHLARTAFAANSPVEPDPEYKVGTDTHSAATAMG